MSGAIADPRLQPARAAPKARMKLSWSDPTFRNLVWQVVIIGALVAVVSYLVHNMNVNLAARGIATGFSFLGHTAGIPIGEHSIPYDPAVNTYGQALLIGVINTLKVAVIGVVLATILGTLIGISRLSKNWLLAKIAAVYVEVIRDIPLLLQLFFWYALVQMLPSVRGAMNPIPGVFVSNRGLQVPLLDWQAADSWALAAFLLGLIARSRSPGSPQAPGGDRHSPDDLAGDGWVAGGLPARRLGGRSVRLFIWTCRSRVDSISGAAARSARNLWP